MDPTIFFDEQIFAFSAKISAKINSLKVPFYPIPCKVETTSAATATTTTNEIKNKLIVIN